MNSTFFDIGLYWQPLGGNNIDQISGHCYRYTDVVKSGNKIEISTIIVDVGKFDNHQALGIMNSSAAVPDIRDFLDKKRFPASAILLTHSHPDHLNGIVHYLKAGYKLPPLYSGKYTFMILEDLLEGYEIPREIWPQFCEIKDRDVLRFGSMEVEALASSHTCFDSFGFVIKTSNSVVYHTGDMKIDSSTYFRKPTNLKRILQLRHKISFVVADFYGIYDDGFATREVATFKKISSLIKKSRKDKILIPVYPTHPEMYITAFLAALKQKKDVVFYGNTDFYGYLNLIIKYGVDFKKLAKNRIRVFYADREEVDVEKNYAVIGTFNKMNKMFKVSSDDTFGIITAKTFFNPLKGQLNSRNIKFAGIEDAPELQGVGHGFLGDYELLAGILTKAVFIPTHCPTFVIDNFRILNEAAGIKMISETPCNNQIFRLNGDNCELVQSLPAKWLVVVYSDDTANFSEVFQRATSGAGFLKRTISNRRCQNRFKMFLHKRKKDKKNDKKARKRIFNQNI